MRFIKATIALSLAPLVLAAPSTQPRHDARGVGLPIGGRDGGLPLVGGLTNGLPLVGGLTGGLPVAGGLTNGLPVVGGK